MMISSSSSSCCRRAAAKMSPSSVISSRIVPRARTRGFRSTARVAVGGLGYGNVQDRLLAREHLYHHTDEPHTVSVIGAPMTHGQPFVGTDVGPMLLRKAGLLQKLTSLGWRVDDQGDLDFNQTTTPGGNNSNNSNSSGSRSSRGNTNANTAAASSNLISQQMPPFWGNAKNAAIVGRGSQQLCQLVATKMQQGRFPLILGGDHSIAIGSLAGILSTRPETGILWIDAHADLNTPDISESGNMHGMPIGMLMNYSRDSRDGARVPGFAWLDSVPKLQPEQIVYIGLRDVDAAERDLIRSLGILAFTMHEIDRYGIGKVMEMALGHLLNETTGHGNRPLHLSYDIDAVDPALAPATGTTVRGGLTYREAHYVAEAVAYTGKLASAEIVELNPSLSHAAGAEETVELGLQLITSFMGKSII